MLKGLKKYFKIGNLSFLMLQLYMFIYFYQPAERYLFLQPFKLEMLVAVLGIASVILDKKNIKIAKIDKIIVVFFLVIIVSSIFSIWKSHSFDATYEIFKLFILYSLISISIDQDWKLKHFMIWFLILSFIIIWEPVYMGFRGEFLSRGEGGILRAKGLTNITGNPNTFGGFAAATLPFVYFLFRLKLSKSLKLLVIFYIVIILIGVKFSESRGAMLTVIVFGGIIYTLSKHKLINLFIGIFLLLIIWNVVLDETTRNRFLSLQQIQTAFEIEDPEERVGQTSISTRLQIYLDGLELFIHRPILGYGTDAFSTARGRRFGRWQNAHNLYIQVLVDLGIIGFSVFMYLILHIIYVNYKIYNFSKKYDELRFFQYVTIAVIAYLILRLQNGMFGHSLYIYYWWIMAGITKVTLFLFEKEYLKYSSKEIGEKSD